MCQLHLASSANQARFVRLRQTDRAAAAEIARSEIILARWFLELVAQDSRTRFAGTNQYACVGLDLAEKILICHDAIHQLAQPQRAQRPAHAHV